MNLLEYEAKALLATANLPIPKGTTIDPNTPAAPFLPLVLKSQVPTGGRGKAGGVVVARSEETFQTAKQSIFALSIKGFLPTSLLAEELVAIDRELYLALLIDRTAQEIQLVAHTNGGMEVEDNSDFERWPITQRSDTEQLGQQLADYFGLPDKTFILEDFIQRLFDCFVKNDATLIEINPLILTRDGRVIAGDAKITLDDAAAFRHDWHFEETLAETNFVTINPDGDVATIANGAGLAMATVDAAYDAGLTPANFLDVGGGANVDTLLAAFHRILEYPNVRAIVINIFAGITRSDEVARAIIAAKAQLPNLPPLSIRIAGTGYDEAKSLLDEQAIILYPTLEECLAAAKENI
jgi:succinyl-CoA synthetase beta subunit